jgi:hypothetical protein
MAEASEDLVERFELGRVRNDPAEQGCQTILRRGSRAHPRIHSEILSLERRGLIGSSFFEVNSPLDANLMPL